MCFFVFNFQIFFKPNHEVLQNNIIEIEKSNAILQL